MNEDDQRITIAELMGWTYQGLVSLVGPGDPRCWRRPDGFFTSQDAIPDYVSSLDAARQAVFTWMGQPEEGETFSRSHQDRFADQLEIIGEREQVPLWMLGAAQWCEALLKVTNKWVD